MKTFGLLLLWVVVTITLSNFGNWALGFLSPFLILPFYRFPIWKSTLLGFIVGAISWVIPAVYLDLANQHQLGDMVANLLKVNSSITVIILTGLLGGLGVSVAAWMMAILFRQDKLIH